MTNQTNILIATPAYGGNIHVEYLHSILAFKKAGIKFAVQTISNESLITRARNTLLTNFWKMKQYTHLLFLDADVFLDSHGLMNMVSHDKDVIGAPVALKGRNENGEIILNTEADPNLEIKLQIVKRVGTAALLFSRAAIGALVEDAITHNRIYYNKHMVDQDGKPETFYDVFQVGVMDGNYLSEDFWVCERLAELGFNVFVDTSAYTRHNGVVAFDNG